MSDLDDNCLINLSCPDLNNGIVFNNPFDIVSMEAEAYDPFEMVFQSAYCKKENALGNDDGSCDNLRKQSDKDVSDSGHVVAVGLVEDNVSSKEDNHLNAFAESNVKVSSNTENKVNCLDVTKEVVTCRSENILVNNNDDKNNTKVKVIVNNSYNNDVLPSSSNQTTGIEEKACESSFSSLDMTNEDTIKASIAKRIDKCAQNVTKSTMENKDAAVKDRKTQLSTSQVRSTSTNCINEISPVDAMDCDEFNKAFHYVSSSSRYSTPVKATQESNDDVFLEARKLGEVFKEMSFRVNKRNCSSSNFDANDESDESFDILTEKITWDPVDSSDEEADLCKDPALNLKFTSKSMEQLPTTPKKSVELSEVVVKYMQRRSLDLDTSTSSLNNDSTVSSAENHLKRSNSFNGSESVSKKKETPKMYKPFISDDLIKKPIQIATVREDVIAQKLKSLKSSQTVSKRPGPMRATMPLHTMTREIGVKKQQGSPIRNFKRTPQVNSKYGSPKRKTNNNSRPVASSTPKKYGSPKPSPATSPILPVKDSPSTKQQGSNNSFDSANLRKRELQMRQRQLKSSSWSSDSMNKENSHNFSVSDELKKPTENKLSQLPILKSTSVLNSRNGNLRSPLPLTPRHINVAAGLNKISANFVRKRSLLGSSDKENSFVS